MIQKANLFLCLACCLVAAPVLMAETTAADTASPADATLQTESSASATTSALPVEPQALPRSFEEILNDATRVELSGCTASFNCDHGGTVTCSSPGSGSCTSTGSRCGGVTCNGTTTWCPGTCYGNHHCYGFCGNTFDSYCDSFGCCVCP